MGMIMCPVCEHVQQHGGECDRCGKLLAAVAPAEVPVAPLPELEVTRHAGTGGALPTQALPELESTAVRSGPDLPPESIQDLEHTRAEPVAVAAAALPELERGREEGDGTRTAAPTGAVTCRYCRNVQAEGMFCDRCGMRLPRVAVRAERSASGVDVRSGADAVWTRCRRCGAVARGGRRCGDCGHLVPMPEP